MGDRQKELREAIVAADSALAHLNAAGECLRKAGNWGLVDLLGGGFLSTMMKHGRMDDAEREMTAAKDALRRFARELGDVDAVLDADIQVGDFLKFADLFFDGMVADWMVQSRISAARSQVDQAASRVRQIKAQLERML